MSEKHISISITTGTIVHAMLIGILFWLVYVLRDIALVVLSAVVIASAMEPAIKWFGSFKIPRVAGVLLTYAIVFFILGGVVYLFIPLFIEQLGNVAGLLPKYLDMLSSWTASPEATVYAPKSLVGDLSDTFSVAKSIEAMRMSMTSATGDMFHLAGTVFGGVFGFILVVVLSFYLAVQEHGVEDFLRFVAPAKYEPYIVGLWKRSQAKIGKWMQGQLLLGVLIGVLVYLGLTILGVEYALVLALIAAVAELIPIFGPIISAVPAIAIGFLDSMTSGLVITGLYVIIQQFENHLIYPLVVRKVVGVPPIVSILALVIGGNLAGFVGMLLSVPIATVIMELMDDMYERKRSLLTTK
ncbi:MAG: AI-2E family transporter [Candidatus Yonathbacteria bacterium]|nr:AI-2E family transporter [Candidatus Yonathbacteria bacterium]NTW48073.1 AI-2E family transporter [Candidatus Yonathbacteria bacterium]